MRRNHYCHPYLKLTSGAPWKPFSYKYLEICLVQFGNYIGRQGSPWGMSVLLPMEETLRCDSLIAMKLELFFSRLQPRWNFDSKFKS
ncbi:hypothetical protein evm_001186 [Chilo suppressalis]|nr:hypothetical protein evm_001186 [Chilo suppressalis]